MVRSFYQDEVYSPQPVACCSAERPLAKKTFTSLTGCFKNEMKKETKNKNHTEQILHYVAEPYLEHKRLNSLLSIKNLELQKTP
jgi:hypothetical protein